MPLTPARLESEAYGVAPGLVTLGDVSRAAPFSVTPAPAGVKM
jgi:hypothetical protein